ncbi:MAG TPA: DMT family transporter [Mobilitalea sp.]|nr:DMT family transporter [Mobilitalea sp.]
MNSEKIEMRFGNRAVLYAILAAALYALSAPLSKLLLNSVSVTMMAAFLYLGAGFGMLIIGFTGKFTGKENQNENITRKDLPYVFAMVILDIMAPIFLMLGISNTTAANASLLNNFEIVATSVIALMIFHETISKRLRIAIALVTISSMMLSFEDISSLSFSIGSLFILLACICWGFENNCTRMLANKNPLRIVVIKGLCSGAGSFLIANIVGESMPKARYIILTMLLGFVAYGLSIFFYVSAQRYIGAAKTSTYYAIAPFIGVLLSFIILREIPGKIFFVAMGIMLVGTYLVREKTLTVKDHVER